MSKSLKTTFTKVILTAFMMLSFMANAADQVKFGSVLDRSGVFGLYGKPMDKAERLAIKQINAAGGLLGKKVKYIGYDTQSKVELYTQFARKLAREDKVDAVHGGIISSTREAIRSMLHKYKTPYFYNVLYEGGVCNSNFVGVGITPAQQVEVLIPYIVKKWGKKAYILAANYNYGHNQAKWIKHYLKENGAEAVAVDFFPLDVTDFSSTINKIQKEKPDMVISVLVGGAHMSFYRQWAAAGMKDKIPMASTTLGVGNEHKVLTAKEGNGIIVAYNYSKNNDSRENKAFIKAWEKAYGNTDDLIELAASHYQGVMLWAQAVKNAKSATSKKVFKALENNLKMNLPSGVVEIDPKTHHAILDVHIMEVQNQQLTVLDTFKSLQPSDTQKYCDLIKTPKSNKQFEVKL